MNESNQIDKNDGNGEENDVIKDRKLDLDEATSTKVFNVLDELIRKQAVILRPSPKKFSVGISKRVMKRDFPSISTSELERTIRFSFNYFHSVENKEFDEFVERFREEDREKARELAKNISAHRKSKLFAFRVIRKCNYYTGDMVSHKKVIKDESSGSERIIYHDIAIQYINNEGNEATLRLEADEIELEWLIEALEKILGRG